MVFVIQVCWQLVSRVRISQWYMSCRFADSLRAGSGVPSWSCWQAVSKPVWHTPLLCVQWKTSDDGHRNCPKHVEFYSKNKFEKLVHLVGFIIKIYMYMYLCIHIYTYTHTRTHTHTYSVCTTRGHILGNTRYQIHRSLRVTIFLSISLRLPFSSSHRAASEFPIYFPQLRFSFASRNNLQST